LTTFDNSISLLGKTSADMLALHGEPHRSIFTVKCPIVIRESTEISQTPVRDSSWHSGMEE